MSLPKVGDKIPIGKFWVSKTNMRVDEVFGESDEDKALIDHFRRASVVQPFKARPEDEGYGVFVGGRRFQAMKLAGYKDFVVGDHVWIEDVTNEEAMDASLKENLEEFHKAPDPITRAKAINAYLTRMPTGIRGLARSWNMPHSTLVEYLKILDLSLKMQEVVRKGLIPFYEGIAVVRLGLGMEAQDNLADLIEKEGKEAFKKELQRLELGKGKRGIPKGKYFIDRVIWDIRSRKDMENREIIKKVAETKGMTEPEYIKDYIIRHIDEIAKEIT